MYYKYSLICTWWLDGLGQIDVYVYVRTYVRTYVWNLQVGGEVRNKKTKKKSSFWPPSSSCPCDPPRFERLSVTTYIYNCLYTTYIYRVRFYFTYLKAVLCRVTCKIDGTTSHPPGRPADRQLQQQQQQSHATTAVVVAQENFEVKSTERPSFFFRRGHDISSHVRVCMFFFFFRPIINVGRPSTPPPFGAGLYHRIQEAPIGVGHTHTANNK